MSDKPDRSERELSAIRNYPRLVRRYARLVELTSDLVSTLDLDSVLRHVVNAVQELTECEAASLMLYDPQSHQLYFEAATNELTEGVGRTAVPAESSIAGWVFKHGEPLVVEDALREPRFFREVDVLTRFRTKTVLGVPLRTKMKTLGVIEALNKRHGMFDDQDVRLMQALAAQAAIAIENSRLFQQSDVIAEMVHELRTPLSSLMAAAYLLQRPDLPDDQRQRLGESIYGESKRLNEMATGFLDLSRLESGRTRFLREPVHLGGLVRECLEIVRPQAESERIVLSTDVDPTLAPVHGDRNLLKQLLLNLLTNALKYNRTDGSVLIAIRSENGDVALSVTDTGRGIPPESMAHIFERFYRVPDQEGQVLGTGLGLAIAKRIADGHRGRIEVTSEPGKGSTFTVHLPAE